MSIQRFETGPRMSQVVVHGNTVYLAGVVASNAAGKSVTEQTQDILATIDGHLAKAGSPHLRWALVEAAVHAHRSTAPDVALYRATRERRSATVAKLTVARKIGKRVFHTLRELELDAA